MLAEIRCFFINLHYEKTIFLSMYPPGCNAGSRSKTIGTRFPLSGNSDETGG